MNAARSGIVHPRIQSVIFGKDALYSENRIMVVNGREPVADLELALDSLRNADAEDRVVILTTWVPLVFRIDQTRLARRTCSRSVSEDGGIAPEVRDDVTGHDDPAGLLVARDELASDSLPVSFAHAACLAAMLALRNGSAPSFDSAIDDA